MISKIDFIQNIDSGNFFLIAGPCIIESESDTFKIVYGSALKQKVKLIYNLKYK